MFLNKNRINNFLLLLATTAFCLAIAEVTIRFAFGDRLNILQDERNLTYRYDSLLGWFPLENSSKQYKGNRLIDVEHNSRGFRDKEHIVSSNSRILFLGDSFVWGYDVEQSERFTEKLDGAFSGWSVYNLGVSGYGTDQEYLLLEENYDYYKPDIVFLVFCTDNDELDNTRNSRYGGYYKPYFVVNKEGLELKGTPVPKSENHFLVEHNVLARSYLARLIVKRYFEFTSPPYLELESPTHEIISSIYELSISKGFQFVVGLQERSPQLESFLSDKKIPYVTLSNPYRYASHGNHWTPRGHTFVAERISSFLTENDYLSRKPPPAKKN